MNAIGTTPTRASARPLLLFALAALATLLLYWPGLQGGYIFDDFSFVVQNEAVHVTDATLGAWIRAALSFPAGHQGRWLTMLTFAANYAATGIDPFWMKLTNVGIHIVNGLLLFFALRALLDLWSVERGTSLDPSTRDRVAVAIAACWLLLPINLTAVLYVAQRLESFSNTFVFAGLWWYLRARVRLARGERAIGAMAAALVVGTGVGLLAKESAVLLPLYTACVEFAIPGLRDRDGRWRKPVLTLYGALLVVPLIAGLVWLSTWMGGRTTYVRQFTTLERLMTESRILVDYIGWTLLPLPHSLSLYHDDIELSRGLLTPWTTLASIATLVALAAVALQQRRRRPLFCLGILWFFAAHTLTGTIIPLELVYEHRNYFASCGLLLSLASILSLEPVLPLQARSVGAIALAAIAFFAFNTALRAREWGRPLSLALSEVGKHPQSTSAQYELARVLIVSSQYKADSPLLPRARQALETGMHLPNSDTLCEAGLIVLAAHVAQPIDPALWTSMEAKLRKAPPTENDASGLANLTLCQTQDVCPRQVDELGKAFTAAMSHPTPSPRLLSAYGDFAAMELHDNALAESLMRQAIARKPNEADYRSNLVQFLAAVGRKGDAENELAKLEALNRFGSLDARIAMLRETLATPPAPSGGAVAQPSMQDSGSQ